MDTSGFTNPDDGFPLLDLTAKFAFKTNSSISFEVGRIADVAPADQLEFVISAFEVVGWLDVHHPCDSFVRAQIRICLPVEYHPFERMAAMVKVISETLSIPPEDHCELTVFNSDHVTGILPKVYFGMG